MRKVQQIDSKVENFTFFRDFIWYEKPSQKFVYVNFGSQARLCGVNGWGSGRFALGIKFSRIF